MRDKEYFWNTDISVLLRQWRQDIAGFARALLLFAGLSLPVVIPALILWFLLSINFSMAP
jgi:hypothetical protein